MGAASVLLSIHPPHSREIKTIVAVTIRVLIVDDHAVLRAGLRMLIDAEEDMETVGEAGNVRDAIFETRSTTPDLVLMDVVMPGESGLEGVPKLLHEQPDLKVLILSMQDDPSYVREAFAAGARGYVLKEAADAEVVAAIREVAAGGRYVHPELGARLITADAEAAEAGRRGPALRPRARGPHPARPRVHEPGDRQAALHLGAHGRDSPGPRDAEAPARKPGRARQLRARERPARELSRAAGFPQPVQRDPRRAAGWSARHSGMDVIGSRGSTGPLSSIHPFDIEGAKARLTAADGGYEVLHESAGLEIGVYVLIAPEPDRQQPHEDDEVYIVLEGRGVLEIEGRPVELREGHAVFVPAGAEHLFTGYEQLAVLVIFERR